MKKIIMVVAAILGMASYSAPVRSMLGAQGAINKITAAEPWMNPYITDGLIAMWDGEWNAGPGKHDPNATIWIDISGNEHDFQDLVPNGWTSDHGRLLAARAISIKTLLLSDEVMTVSVCCKGVGTTESSRCLATLVQGAKGLWFYKDRLICQKSITYSPSIDIKNLDSFTIEYSASTLNNFPQNLGWFGDVPCENYLREWIGFSSNPGIGDITNNYIVPFLYGTIYNVRIYNRYLTQEEITYNWDIDKERFGL